MNEKDEFDTDIEDITKYSQETIPWFRSTYNMLSQF